MPVYLVSYFNCIMSDQKRTVGLTGGIVDNTIYADVDELYDRLDNPIEKLANDLKIPYNHLLASLKKNKLYVDNLKLVAIGRDSIRTKIYIDKPIERCTHCFKPCTSLCHNYPTQCRCDFEVICGDCSGVCILCSGTIPKNYEDDFYY